MTDMILKGFGTPMTHMCWEQWRKWVDDMHRVPVIDTKTVKAEFRSMWYPEQDEELNPIHNEYRLAWKELTQRAFIDGYEAGFSDKLLRGESK